MSIRQDFKLIAIIILSIIAGLVVYLHIRYQAGSLVIQAKTLEKGLRHIYATGDDRRGERSVSFSIGSDGGDSCVYTLDLPSIALNSVRIPPLAAQANFEIERLSLGNAAITYRWDDRLVCSQHFLRDGLVQNMPCDGNAPAITIDNDNSIRISSIGAAGFVTPTVTRLFLSFVAVIGVFLCGCYLMFVPGGVPTVSGIAVRAGHILVVGLFLVQLGALWSNAVDIPYYEEWEFFAPAALPRGLNWQWLSEQISHQRMMVFTKLMAWANYRLFSLDFINLKLSCYGLFGCLLVALVRFKSRVIGNEFSFFPLFMVFMLSPIVYEVHVATFQSGETFVVFCSLLMLLTSIDEKPSAVVTFAFSLCAIAAMYSLSAGVVYASVMLLGDALYTVAVLMKKRHNHAVSWERLLGRLVLVVPAIVIWFMGLQAPEAKWGVPPRLLPLEGKFWEKFLNLLSYCYGFDRDSLLAGILCLLLLVVPICLLLGRPESRWEPATWRVIIAIASGLAVVALISVGRGNMGFSIKVSRYTIFGLLLIPYGAMAWWLAIRTKALRIGVLILLWCFSGVAFFDNWDYGVYRDVGQLEKLNLECVERYASGTGDGMCPETFFMPIGKYFDNAKALNVHFTRQFAPHAQ